MINCRYDKLNALIHLQNQKSHYNRMLDAKKSIDFKQQPIRYHTLANLKTGYSKSKQRQRKQNNSKLVNKLVEINQTNGVLKSAELHARNDKQIYTLSTRYDSYHKTLEDHQIKVDNSKIAEKLRQMKPVIGSKSKWEEHFGSFKAHQKKLKKYSLCKQYDPEQYLKQTYTSHFKSTKRGSSFYNKQSKDSKVSQHDPQSQLWNRRKKQKVSKQSRRTKSKKSHYQQTQIPSIIENRNVQSEEC